MRDSKSVFREERILDGQHGLVIEAPHVTDKDKMYPHEKNYTLGNTKLASKLQNPGLINVEMRWEWQGKEDRPGL